MNQVLIFYTILAIYTLIPGFIIYVSTYKFSRNKLYTLVAGSLGAFIAHLLQFYLTAKILIIIPTISIVCFGSSFGCCYWTCRTWKQLYDNYVPPEVIQQYAVDKDIGAAVTRRLDRKVIGAYAISYIVTSLLALLANIILLVTFTLWF